MTPFHGRTETTRDDWQTPIELVRSLGEFDLDPCANADDPTRVALSGLTFDNDGLSRPWNGRVFINPPYGGQGGAKIWMERLGNHGNGIALIPPRVGAKWFHDVVLSSADAVFFMRGRVSFIQPETGERMKGNNADSVLVAYGPKNVAALQRCGLDGKLWRLR